MVYKKYKQKNAGKSGSCKKDGKRGQNRADYGASDIFRHKGNDTGKQNAAPYNQYNDKTLKPAQRMKIQDKILRPFSVDNEQKQNGNYDCEK